MGISEFTLPTVTGVCGFVLGIFTRLLDKFIDVLRDERKEKRAAAVKLVEKRRQLLAFMRCIPMIEGEVQLPRAGEAVVYDPTPMYTGTTIVEINGYLARGSAILCQLLDLPEAKRLLDYQISLVNLTKFQQGFEEEMKRSFETGLLPLRAIYAELKCSID
jgi:hypothetical protein